MTVLPVSTLASLIFFSSIALGYAVYKVARALRPAAGPVQPATTEIVPSSGKLPEGLDQGEKSLEQLARAGTELGVLALITWVCENRPFFSHANKIHDVDFFWFIVLTAFLVSVLFSVHVAPKDLGILNRDQTEEWRGFMQMVFLLYHYFALEEVYPLIRLFISCYVFLTGFGNTSFFYLKRDYSIVRLLSMLWRLGFSCLVLAMVHDNPIILYYIVPLHTFYFLVSYVTMSLFEQRVNYTKHGLKIKLVVLGLILYSIWEFPEVFEVVFSFLSNEPHPGAPVGAYGTRYEWQFRSGLDHYSSFFGMVFACGFPLLQLRETAVVSKSRVIQFGLAGAFAAMFLAWCLVLFPMAKFEFNARHAYTFVFPMCGYLFLRNLTPYLRRVHLGMFAYAGKYTLETYLLQHHVWLTSNAKTVLVLIPGFPKANFLLVSAVYFILSVKLYDLTVKTKVLLIPSHDAMSALMNVLSLAGAVGLCMALAQFIVYVSDGSLELILTTVSVIALAAFWLFAAGLFVRMTTSSNGDESRGGRTAPTFCKGLIVILSMAFFAIGLVCAAFPVVPQAASATCDPNAGGWVRTFNGLCGQAPQTNFAYCSSHGWAWDIIEQRRCGWKRIAKLDQVDRIYLIGRDPQYALALARLEDPKLRYSEKVPTTEFANGKIVLLEKAEDLRGKTLKANTVVICQGVDSYSGCKSRTTGVGILLKNSGDDDDGVEDEGSMVVDARTIKATAPKDTKLDKDMFTEDVYDVVAQVTLNYVARALKKPTKASPPPPGGLAYSPSMGFLFLCISFYALFLADGYLGLVATASRLFRLEGNVTWEKAMQKVHAAVPGLHPDQIPGVQMTATGGVTAGDSDRNSPKELTADEEDTSKLLEKA